MDTFTVTIIVLFAGILILVSGTPQFVAVQNSHIHANAGQTILLRCEITGLNGETISWHYVEHNTQISKNNEILTEDSRFSIVRPLGDAGDQFNLEISGLTVTDPGTYSCRFNDDSDRDLKYHLTIADAPEVAVPPAEEIPRSNFTDCCVRQGVSTSCLPACSPSTLDLNTFDPVEACGLDLPKLLHCGTDGRNHVPCCRRRMVPDACFGFCVNDPPLAVGPSLTQCLDVSAQITACFEEGQHLLSTAPMFITGEAISPTRIFIKWSSPAENPATVTFFKLFYQKDGSVGYSSTLPISSTEFHYTLSGLEPSTKYNLYLISINNHGSSLPSYIIQVITQSGQTLPPGIDHQALPACCERRGVTGMCKDFLCSGRAPTASEEDKLQCYTQIDEVLACISGERNHTDCCMRMDLPRECYALCSGQVTGLDYQQLGCFAYMGQIGSCFQEGTDTVPGVPRGVNMQRVGAHQAVVEWEPLEKNADQLIYYSLRYKETSASTYTEISVNKDATQATLAELKESTLYQAQVIAVGAQGTSVPSISTIFLTYMEDGGVLPYSTTTGPSTTPPPHDVKQCCADMGVSERCLHFCSYEVTFNNVAMEDILGCENELGKLLSCGADGRNHTKCCQEEGVLDMCWQFCAFTPEQAKDFTFNWDHVQCLPSIGDVINCMEDGTGKLPSNPRNLQVVNVTTHTISLLWVPPLRIGDPALAGVTYEVQYKLTDMDEVSWNQTETSKTAAILQSLTPDKSYTVRVVAKNVAGYSIYSPEVVARTATNQLPLNLTAPTDLTDCCQGKGVKAACLSACSGVGGVINMHECSADMGKVINCARDDRDHTQCCERMNVPEHCRGFCDGTMEVSDFTSLLCLSVTPQIFTCFREGYEKLPSMPDNFHVYNISATYVELRWKPPKNNPDGTKYDLYYKQMYLVDFTYKADVTSPFKFTGLKPTTHYIFYLVARNAYGSSPPTPSFSVWTSKLADGEITIDQQPPNPVRLNERVVLTCSSKAEPDYSVYWMRNGTRVDRKELVIESVQKTDVGTYSCVANSPSGQNAQDQFLKLEFALEVHAREKIVKVEAHKGLTAHMQCNFKGSPSVIEWYKNDQLLIKGDDDSTRYMWARHIRPDEGLVESHFSVLAVGASDFAVYRCHGRNSISENQALIKLTDPAMGPGVPSVPSQTPPAAVMNVTACCIGKKVQGDCLDVCTFDIDVNNLLKKPHCLADASKMVECAADGRDHSQCCAKENIPDNCMNFCSGTVPKELTNDHFICLTQIDTILSCMEKGHDNIPGTPRNVKANVVEGGIQVWWDTPNTNADKVQFYDVHYWATRDPYVVAHSTQRVTLKSIQSHENYQIYVVARNHHGSSHMSAVVEVDVDEMYPSEPLMLIGQLIDGTSVHLRWDPPELSPGYVLFYNIYYAPIGDQDPKMVRTVEDKNTYLLENLKANTRWSIYVTSHGSHHESGKSNVITMETGDEILAGTGAQTGQTKGGGGHGVAIGLGVFFGLLVVAAAVAGFAFWYLRLRKVSHSRFKDSVSFENPGYATMGEPQVVSGIPGEPRLNLNQDHQPPNGGPPVAVNNKDSSIMKEAGDSGSDQGYSTLNYPPSNGDVGKERPYATIGVTTSEPVDTAKVNIHLGENFDDSNT